jgi:transcriptional regulator with XRE-family HTH domain
MAQSTMAQYQTELNAYLKGVAANIRRLREERGLSQTDLYNRADLHRTTVGRVESAKVQPPLTTLVIIADALEVTLDDLVAGLPVPKERKPPPKPTRTTPKRRGSE